LKLQSIVEQNIESVLKMVYNENIRKEKRRKVDAKDYKRSFD
jgi:hypothetical protein